MKMKGINVIYRGVLCVPSSQVIREETVAAKFVDGRKMTRSGGGGRRDQKSFAAAADVNTRGGRMGAIPEDVVGPRKGGIGGNRAC